MTSWNRALVAVALLIAATGCPATGGVDIVEQERMNIASWTIPPGATMTTVPPAHRTGLSGGATWEVSSAMTWSDYRAWNKERSKIGYVDAKSDDNGLAFTRKVSGDQFFVGVRVIAPGPPLRLRVTFTAVPD